MTVWANRYDVIEELGRGANGVVYRVVDQKIGRELALKLLPGANDESLVIREAHALTALESPHVLRVFNAGIFGDVPFLATDIAVLGSTEDQLQGGVGVHPDRAVRWVRQALTGLDYCHRRRVLHRDITPANVFLGSIDHALLGDFGVASNLGDDGTAGRAGNQRTLAPEGFGGRLTPASDIYSVGVTLWRLLTGRWPYDAQTEEDLKRMVQGAERPRLRDVAPHVHRSIAKVVESSLEPDPNSRPASAGEMAMALAGSSVGERSWVQVPTGADDLVEFKTTRGRELRATATSDDGRRWTVETRYLSSGRRLVRACFETTSSKLAQQLRRVFDTV